MQPSTKNTTNDTTSSPAPSFPYIDHNDVLIGRLKFCRENGGSRLLRELVEQRFVEYEAAGRSTDYMDEGLKKSKQDIKNEIVATIKATGGRFLKINSKTKLCEGEVPDSVAQAKVVATFKTLRNQTGVASIDPIGEFNQEDIPEQERKTQGDRATVPRRQATTILSRAKSDSSCLSWSTHPSVVDEALSVEPSLGSGGSKNTARNELSADEITTTSVQSSKASSQNTNAASKSTQSSTTTSKLSWNAGSSISRMSVESEFSQLRALSPVREPLPSLNESLTRISKRSLLQEQYHEDRAETNLAGKIRENQHQKKVVTELLYRLVEICMGADTGGVHDSLSDWRAYVVQTFFIVTLIYQYDEDLRLKTCEGLRTIMNTYDDIEAFVAMSGGPQEWKSWMDFNAEHFHDNEKIQELCLAILERFSESPYLLPIMSKGLIKLATKAMATFPMNPTIQVRSCASLGNVAGMGDEIRLKIALADGPFLVARAMSSFSVDMDLQKAGCHVFSNLAHTNEVGKNLVDNHDGVRLLLGAFEQFHPETGVPQLSAQALGHLAADEGNNEAITEAGAIRSLAALMSFFDTDEELQTSCCLALSNLSMCFNNRHAIIETGGIELILNAMKQFQDNEELCLFCCSAIGNLASKDEEVAKEILEKGGFDLVMKANVRFFQESLNEKSRCIGWFALQCLQMSTFYVVRTNQAAGGGQANSRMGGTEQNGSLMLLL